MSVLYPPETPYAKEMCKWEAQGSTMGPGLRPYDPSAQYPKMLYKAGRPDNGLGKHIIAEHCIVESEQEQANMRSRGFWPTQEQALEALDADRLEVAKLAAEIEYDKKHKLSPKAVAEVEAAQAVHHGHLPMVPETPLPPRRGRPAKASLKVKS